MARFSHGRNNRHRGTNANRFKYRNKSIVALLTGFLLIYLLSFLHVVVRVHQLDHVAHSLLERDSSDKDRSDMNDEENTEKIGGGKLDQTGKSPPERVDNSKNTKNINDEEERIEKGSGDKVNESVKAEEETTTSTENPSAEVNFEAEKIKNSLLRYQKSKLKNAVQEENDSFSKIKPKVRGDKVSPDILLERAGTIKIDRQNPTLKNKKVSEDQVLTAYLEITDRSTWETKPLPVRNVKAEDLIKTQFPKLSSCSKLPEQWPVDDYPVADPFLPWIHDVFPTDDGKYIQFVAQNRRRCFGGTAKYAEFIVNHTAPQAALFQHVPLKKIENSTEKEPRYRLSSHDDADPESIDTRFICRFKPSGDITFSEFNNDYEWAAVQKKQKIMFKEHSGDNNQIHTSQLIFRCPVPNQLVELVRTGDSVQNDWATIFVDLIPVRTPPRYGPPDQFLVPRYEASQGTKEERLFNTREEWGEEHILPKLDDSGRWENIPVCKPSLMTYEPQALKGPKRTEDKQHHLVSCLWASTGYTTRGNRYAVNDGQRRLLEWITFNKILGFDHFYIYDNSGAFGSQGSLQPIADLFPEDITLINWPSRVCNNNPNFADSVGERSSQYAAETSCRLRFGSHTNWIGQFDVDEYLIPMGNFTSVLPLLEKLDREGNKIISFASWRAWPRRTHINDPEETTFKNKKKCLTDDECFELSVKKNTTILEAYNCDRQKPGKKGKTMPAEKQIYRADYVKQHFIHYSTITDSSNLNRDDFREKFGNVRPFPDRLSRFSDEVNEALMLHSKSIARQDTAGWKKSCSGRGGMCRIGFPWPADGSKAKTNEDGWKYNCYVNPRIDNYFAPKVQARLAEMGFMESTSTSTTTTRKNTTD